MSLILPKVILYPVTLMSAGQRRTDARSRPDRRLSPERRIGRKLIGDGPASDRSTFSLASGSTFGSHCSWSSSTCISFCCWRGFVNWTSHS
jgi:hypothetical protein